MWSGNFCSQILYAHNAVPDPIQPQALAPQQLRQTANQKRLKQLQVLPTYSEEQGHKIHQIWNKEHHCFPSVVISLTL